MANSHNVQHPDPDPPPSSLFLKSAGGIYYACAIGATSSGSTKPNAVYAQIFGTAAETDPRVNPPPAPGGGGAWVAASILTGGGGGGPGMTCWIYQFGPSDGNGTIPNAQIGPGNYLAVYAFFADDPMTAVPSTSFPVQFYGSHSRMSCNARWIRLATKAPSLKGMRVAKR